jgi:hypothetical protein
MPLVDRKKFGRIESNSPSGSNSAVECDLAKVEVAGSNPVSRSTVSRAKARGSSSKRELPSPFISGQWRRSQVVRQRSAKPLSIGSIPIAASTLFNHLQASSKISIQPLRADCVPVSSCVASFPYSICSSFRVARCCIVGST